MEKILVEVYLPTIDEDFDVYISLNSKVYEVTNLLSKALLDLCQDQMVMNQQLVLCSKETGHPLDINLLVKEASLVNGSKLMLI